MTLFILDVLGDFEKVVIQMKSIKKLIIASALSMMAASCYASSFLPNTEHWRVGGCKLQQSWTTTSTAYSSVRLGGRAS
ncbi:hypothetical protein ACI1MS_01935 [Salmonella enterica subsp. enterica serovar Enteritidis]|uniref:hypothetical protein n=1 Tax=Salmonella enterica TaxID=28901 RepID=UPI003857B1AA